MRALSFFLRVQTKPILWLARRLLVCFGSMALPFWARNRLALDRGLLSTTVWALGALTELSTFAQNSPARSDLTLASSSDHLISAFNWNKAKALNWVRTSVKPGYIPCYWAGYNYREAFYVRDIAHQCEGAALLGLNNENFSMWRALASTASESRQWFCLWALDFYGNTYAVDYRSDTNFVREIPAPLELVDKAYRCYRWSGDRRWISDPVLTNFYWTTMNLFIAKHDENNDGIAEGRFIDIFDGACGSYCEQSAGGYGVGGDNIATTWAAYNSYGKLLSAMGKASEAPTYFARADKVKRDYDQNWWNAAAGSYYAGRTIGLSGWITNFDQYSKETYYFQAIKGIAEPGPKANALLDKIHENNLANWKKYNFESVTYLPEVFYNYGMNERGWYWLKCLLDSHYPYPEVSYTAVEFVATGLMGIEPDAPHQKISTLGRLTPDIDWVQLEHIPVGAFDVFVKHEDANRKTTAKNNTPGTSLTWEARFPASHETLYLDGVPLKARQKTLNGVVISYAEVVLAGGQQKTVSTEAY